MIINATTTTTILLSVLLFSCQSFSMNKMRKALTINSSKMSLPLRTLSSQHTLYTTNDGPAWHLPKNQELAKGQYAIYPGLFYDDSSSDEDIAELAREYGFVYLIHETDCASLEKILESKLSVSAANAGNFHATYLELVHHTTPLIKGYRALCALYFDLDLLNSRNDYHVTNGWAYGQYYEPKPKSSLLSARPHELKKLREVMQYASNEDIRKVTRNNSEVVFQNDVDMNHLRIIALNASMPQEKRDKLRANFENEKVAVIEWGSDLLTSK